MIEKKINKAIANQKEKRNGIFTDVDANKLRNGMTAYLTRKGLCEKERVSFSRIVLSENIQKDIDSIIGKSLVAQWEQKKYNNYKTMWSDMTEFVYADGDTLLGSELQDLYTNYVYAQRNRCAHNLVSYQNNLPSLKTLTDKTNMYNNYYLHFSILILLDEIFVRLYKKYQAVLMQTVW